MCREGHCPTRFMQDSNNLIGYCNTAWYAMFLSCSPMQERNQRKWHRGGASSECALPCVPLPPLHRPTGENVPIFPGLHEGNFQDYAMPVFKNRDIFEHRQPTRCRGFLRGYAFSECPLKSPSFRPFLGRCQEKDISLLQKPMDYCNFPLRIRKQITNVLNRHLAQKERFFDTQKGAPFGAPLVLLYQIWEYISSRLPSTVM